jgi:regulator of telomere elongation helicase 1
VLPCYPCRINLTEATWPTLAGALDRALDLLSTDAVEAGRKSGARATSYRLHALSDALRLAFASASAPSPGSQPLHRGYRVHVHMEASTRGGRPVPTLSYWCFAPGQSMAALTDMKVGG